MIDWGLALPPFAVRPYSVFSLFADFPLWGVENAPAYLHLSTGRRSTTTASSAVHSRLTAISTGESRFPLCSGRFWPNLRPHDRGPQTPRKRGQTLKKGTLQRKAEARQILRHLAAQKLGLLKRHREQPGSTPRDESRNAL